MIFYLRDVILIIDLRIQSFKPVSLLCLTFLLSPHINACTLIVLKFAINKLDYIVVGDEYLEYSMLINCFKIL